MDLSHMIRNDDNKLASRWKAEKQWFDTWHRPESLMYCIATRSILWPIQPPLKGCRKITLLQ